LRLAQGDTWRNRGGGISGPLAAIPSSPFLTKKGPDVNMNSEIKPQTEQLLRSLASAIANTLADSTIPTSLAGMLTETANELFEAVNETNGHWPTLVMLRALGAAAIENTEESDTDCDTPWPTHLSFTQMCHQLGYLSREFFLRDETPPELRDALVGLTQTMRETLQPKDACCLARIEARYTFAPIVVALAQSGDGRPSPKAESFAVANSGAK